MAITFSRTPNGDIVSDHHLIAQVLREALPYIDFLKGKTLVIKLGGSTLEHQRTVLQDIIRLRSLGANPGLASINAVIRPASTNYLFFVAKNDGTHVFAETLEEHLRNVEQYQQ